MKAKSFFIYAIAALTVTLSSRPAVHAGESEIKIFTSVAPLAYFVERIGGDRVDARALVKSGSSPATYEPTPRQMAALSKAKLYVRVGVPFENALMPKIKKIMKTPRIIDVRKGVPLRQMKSNHHHGGGHNHHDGADPHVWLNPRLVKIQARSITAALRQIDPKGGDVYERNLNAFLKDLEALDAELAETLAPVKGMTFLVFHPSWGYFADAYGLEQEPIELEGKAPSARRLVRVIDMAKAKDARIVFVQPQFSQTLATRVAEAIGGEVKVIDPLASDYAANLRRVAAALNDALGKRK